MRKIRAYLRFFCDLAIFHLFPFAEFRAIRFFPFDHNQPLPAGSGKVMEKCCRALDGLGINYRLTDGTVLGLHRQGCFIPHDNDIDVDVLDFNDFEQIHLIMKSLGLRLGRKAVYKHKVQQLVYFSDDHVVFDMIFWRSSGSEIYNYSEEGYERIQSAEFFYDLGTIEFSGWAYPVPSRLEDWLVLRYGDDWRVPKTYKGDWKIECLDLSKIEK